MLRDFKKEKYDIFIQAGQSNSEGYGFGPVDTPFCQRDPVYYLNPDFIISMASERINGNEIQSNFSLPFADEYISQGYLEEGRKILIIRAAVGGTGFLDGRWRAGDDLFLRMMDLIGTAVELNDENRLLGLLWHQGETDALLHADYDTHYSNLSTLVRLVRETFNVPNLPFIAGDFVQHWKGENLELCTPVVDAMRAVCQNSGSSAFVETDGLLSNLQELHRKPLGWDDPIHFSRKAIYELGKRYFNAWKAIVSTDDR